MLAIADSDLVGKSFSQDEKEIEVLESFYGNDTANSDEIMKKMGEATVVNALGENITTLLVEGGAVSSEDVVEICGIPHAQIVVVT